MTFVEDALSDDGFLDGRLKILQPRTGFRASVDAVLLAAAVPARPGQSALELGCGAGVAALCLMLRVPGLAVTGVERQPGYADLARRNAARNALALNVVEADLAVLPAALRSAAFDHVLANPPYLPAGSGTAARDAGREAALREETPLDDWIAVAARRLRPGGELTMIQAAERLGGLLGACAAAGLGSVRVLPIAPRHGRAAGRVIVRARKGGRAALELLAPFVLHAGSHHQADGDDMTHEARAILRDGAPLAPMAPGPVGQGRC